MAEFPGLTETIYPTNNSYESEIVSEQRFEKQPPCIVSLTSVRLSPDISWYARNQMHTNEHE